MKAKKKRCMVEFSKWTVRIIVYTYLAIVLYSMIAIGIEIRIAYIVALNDGYNNINIDLSSLIELAERSLLALITYIAAAAFVNRKKIEVGYDPNYDKKFQPPDNDGGEDN